ncbi:helix-turn-helix domain-containing protein [Streptomyces lavendulocolor]|uniref:AraC family transcriptional regulator n=1 Tax=Streptomyces lavendulocolor TaxID=67316 RepID=UPI003C2AD351
MTQSAWSRTGYTVLLPLDEPPRVVGLGVGVHGVSSPLDVFRLPELWQLHLYRYAAQLTVEGVTHEVRPGFVSLVPPGSVVAFRYRGRSEHLYAHLGLSGSGESVELPVVQDAGALMPALSDLLLRAVAWAPRAPRGADAEVWTALWRLTELAAPDGAATRPHTAVAQAIAEIESRLAEPLSVPDVARAAGVSHNHLIRLFQAETGGTVVAYIRQRRMERAKHLLRESTLPIPAVAAAVGIADLQAFNKACRRELGASPRALRADGGSRSSEGQSRPAPR